MKRICIGTGFRDIEYLFYALERASAPTDDAILCPVYRARR
jgi:hypothetical protein